MQNLTPVNNKLKVKQEQFCQYYSRDLECFGNGVKAYSKSEFLDRKQEIDNEIAATRISLSESRIEQFDLEGALSYTRQYIHNLSKNWLEISPELKSRFQKLIYPEGISYDREKKFGTAKLGYIFELKETFQSGKSLMVDPTGLEPVTPALQRRCSTK